MGLHNVCALRVASYGFVSVCLAVRPSHAGIVSKRSKPGTRWYNISSMFIILWLKHTITQYCNADRYYKLLISEMIHKTAPCSMTFNELRGHFTYQTPFQMRFIRYYCAAFDHYCCRQNNAIVDIRLRPRCAIASPTSRSILITVLEHPLRGFTRRWMHPLLHLSTGNHRGHCKPFNTNFSTVVYLQMDHYNIISGSILPVYFFNLSPINANFTFLRPCIKISGIFVSPPKFTVTIVTIATAMCVSVILPINRHISMFIF